MNIAPRAGLVSAILAATLALSACVSTSAAQLAREYMQTGDGHYKAKDWDKALRCYDAAVRSNPSDPEAYLRRGNVHIRIARDPEGEGRSRDHEDQALANYSESLRLNPAIADAYFNRAMIWARRANYKEAVKDLLRCSRLRDKDPEPHLLVARLYEEKFDDSQMLMRAMEHYEKFLELGGRDAKAAEKVEAWKQLKQAAAGARVEAAPAASPADSRAKELYEEARKIFAKGDRTDEERMLAVAAMKELLDKHGESETVKQKRRIIEAMMKVLQPAEKP